MAIDRTVSLLVKFAGLDRLTGKMRTIGGASKKTAADIAGTRRAIDGLQRAQAKIAGYRDLENKLRRESALLEEQRERVQRLSIARRAADASGEAGGKKIARALEAAERKEARLIERHGQHGRELQELSRDLDRAGIDVADLARHEERLGHELYETNKRLQQQRQELERRGRTQARVEKMGAIGGRLQSAGAGAVAAGTVVTTPLAFAAREAITFESSMADVRKVVDGMDEPRALKAMGRDILQLSREVPIAAEGLAQIVAAGGQAGIARKELLPFARNAAQMGVAFNMQADQAGETMAKWRTAFRMGQKEVVQLADKVNWLSDKTAAAPEQISSIVTRVGPLGEVAGLAAGEIAAMGATLASMGVQEEIAATGIKNTMLALTKGEAATKEQKKAFTALGLESTQIAKSMQRDATGTIMTVMQKIAALPDHQRAGMLDQLFGSESISAIAPLLTQLPTLRKNLDMVGESGGWAGSMLREFEIRNATSAARLTTFNNRVNALKIGIGERLLPVIERGAAFLGRWADRMSAWIDRHPEAAKWILSAAAAGGVLLVTLGSLALAIGTVLGPLATGIGWLTGLGSTISFVLSPLRLLGQAALWGIGAIAAFVGLPAWIVGAIAVALVAAGVLIWKNWDRIKGWFTQGAQFLMNLRGKFLQIGVQLMVGLINGIASRVAALKNMLLGLGKQAIGWFKGVLGIKSPSRVFMGLGGYMTEGLALGLSRGAEEPIARMRRLAGQVAAAMAVGAVGATPAAGASGAGGTGGRAPVIVQMSVSITITAGQGDSAEDIAERVKQKLEAAARDAANSGYEDDD
ncbi:phage tail tape measure protein [Sphingomonas koreensis]|nr:phage tail tape measure protein [Sphingomonas koreensis]MDC7808800.1 phage tail tape measure protein [Sphingomonas koreensis]RSU98939.1 phage tail tape measure protein [Sphingomonas koreensis]